MQPEEQIAKAPSTDPVKRWMELMAEWEALTAELRDARRAVEQSPAADKSALMEAEAALLAKARGLKEQIDGVLADAASQRQPVNGPLVVGTLITPNKGKR
ncbi:MULTISPECIES: hypothetical protein [unclassified Ensifer]|uniref:hypothetical protein n=1 Tax=unclassified Ensifer TaxID=2633371 RepID=UPI00300F9FEE